MFEWLYQREVYKGDITYTVIGFNKETNNLICEGEDDNKEKCLLEIGLLDMEWHQDITDFENWKTDLYKSLMENGELFIHTLSTESGDSWFVEIKRTEFGLKRDKYEDPITMVNYTILCNSNVICETITFNKEAEAEEKFIKWFESQLEETDAFNYSMGSYNFLNAYTFESNQISKEEIEILYDIHNE